MILVPLSKSVYDIRVNTTFVVQENTGLPKTNYQPFKRFSSLGVVGFGKPGKMCDSVYQK